MAKYLGRRRSPHRRRGAPSLRTTSLKLASVDFFTVPTATFRVLFVFVVLSHNRRRLVHLNVTAHPTAARTAQQLREGWPWDTAPRFLVRDRDGIYGSAFQRVARAMGIDEVLAAPRAPWQNPFVERVIGSLRRECLGHVIVWNERSLRRHLQQYLAYYHDWRNPVVVLDRATHTELTKAQRALDAAQHTPRQNLVANTKLLKQFKVADEILCQLLAAAFAHAASLGF